MEKLMYLILILTIFAFMLTITYAFAEIEFINMGNGVTLVIANSPISCNGIPITHGGCTYYDIQTIYVTDFNQCIILHEYNEHILKKNNVIHYGVCR